MLQTSGYRRGTDIKITSHTKGWSVVSLTAGLRNELAVVYVSAHSVLGSTHSRYQTMVWQLSALLRKGSAPEAGVQANAKLIGELHLQNLHDGSTV